MDWYLYDKDPRHETVKCLKTFCIKTTFGLKSLIKYIQSVYTWNYFGAGLFQ